LNDLLEISDALIYEAKLDFRREHLINPAWTERLISIQGYRGTGKTTLILQHLNFLKEPEKNIYLSLDHFYFQSCSLYETVRDFYNKGFRLFVIDEVHKYPNWSIEIKSLYDSYPRLKMIFSGSSILEIYNSAADLSRRAVSYNLPVLSLREYIELREGMRLKTFSLAELLSDHKNIATQLQSQLGSPLKYFQEYMQFGCYPIFVQGSQHYNEKVMRAALLVLEMDVVSVTKIPFQSVQKLKKLLAFIAQAVPFKPNITELAQVIDAKRDTVMIYLDYLRRAGLLRLVPASGRNMGALGKPEKIYLDNPNLAYALSFQQPNIGTQRETFFLSQVSYKHNVNVSPVGDFLVDDTFTFEIGGKNKTRAQIKKISDAFVVNDDVVIGNNNFIPLWLFGFLY
jgi:uncharacterized protein